MGKGSGFHRGSANLHQGQSKLSSGFSAWMRSNPPPSLSSFGLGFISGRRDHAKLRPIPQPIQIPMVREGAVALFAGGFLKHVRVDQWLG